ncbi:hypothetical protein E4T50_14334 [Aureobasidium sp. EXF-12298]|nr:hypothetical protein E4T50_14334 [Aureobasidium sp. EXF-12298]KAI4770570.1 hypothetical protein E4T52_14419 [Aureobasidium sp. EXF-3400]
MTTAKTNPWLDTVLSKTEPSTPSEPKRSPEKSGPSGHPRPKSSTPNQKTEKKPAQDSLDEAFQAAIKAIVPERLEATRRAKARMELIQGTTQDDLKVAEFTQVTSTTPAPTAQKLSKQKEKPLLQAAIEHLTLDRLHTVLYKTLDESPKARSVFERELLAPLSPDHDDDAEATTAKKKSGSKRPRFEVCRWCKEEFDVTNNPEDACELKPAKHAQRDLDITGDRQTDTDESRENNVEGFVWDCCWANSDGDGCRITAHEIDHDHDPKKFKRS